MNKKIKVLMVAAEATPFVKVGGLADVVGSLPKAMQKIGMDVRLVLPLYGSVDKKKYGLKKIYEKLEIPSGKKLFSVDIYESQIPNSKLRVYFIDSKDFFRTKEVYGGNNSEKFLFFSLASLYMLPAIKFDPDIVHCHDSHVALIPDIIKSSNIEYIKKLKTIYTIHNFSYQGKSEIPVLSTGNLSVDALESLTVDARDGDINFMAQGVLNGDVVTTVSKTYAKEITTSAYGAGLERVIKSRREDLYGILNGIDTDFFDPKKDKHIVKRYSIKSIRQKQRNKLYLQNKLGLEQDKSKPIVALVSRLVWQKGIDLITNKFGQLDCQYVFLGTGNKTYEKHLKDFAKKYPKTVSAKITFNVELAQQIYAGADVFLMPSRFEPCGLGQMIAMRYGTIPVVRRTGGLVDTVNAKVGFSFRDATSDGLYNTLKKALSIYSTQPDKWKQLMINSMNKDFSWNHSAKEYLKVYKMLLKK